MIFPLNFLHGSAEDNGGPCRYDEGGPLVQTVAGQPIAVGLYSKSNATCSGPSVYTRLSSYYAWMVKIAGSQPPAPTGAAPTTTTTTTTEAPTVTAQITTEESTQEATEDIEY